MKKVEDLVPGDALVQDGVRFIVKEMVPLPDGKTAVYFEDMPATEANTACISGVPSPASSTAHTKSLPPSERGTPPWKSCGPSSEMFR